jgi:succinoglycan biosynthesis protein ExoO
MTMPRPTIPAVSVIIPAHDEAPRIERAVSSIGHDEGVSVEILVIDDRSTDGTAAVARAMGDPRLRLLATPPGNGGEAAARNAGLDAARGHWIAFLDADDAWVPGRLVGVLDEATRADADLVVDDVLIETVDAATGETTPISTLFTDRALRVDDGTPLTIEYLTRHDLGITKPIIRRSLIEDRSLRFRPEGGTQDFGFWFRSVAAATNPVLVGRAGYRYLREPGRTTLSTSTPEFWIAAAQATDNLLGDNGLLPRPVAAALVRRARVARRRSRYLTARAHFEGRRWLRLALEILRHPGLLLVRLETMATRRRRRAWAKTRGGA